MTNRNGKLFIIATPIGNLLDITLRALEVLKSVDLILCEDTRVTNALLRHHLINKPLTVYNDHSNESTREKIINKLKSGQNLALVSDAGTPLISDPGYKLVQEIRSQNLAIETLPGACSVISALTLSGLPSDRFMFIGFLPHKNSAKEKIFSELNSIQTTLICFESANRLLETLKLMEQYFIGRSIVIAREITKLYEETIGNNAREITQYYQENPNKLRGEIVMMISPPDENSENSEENTLKQLNTLMKEMSLRDAVEIVANQSQLRKKEIYKLALTLK
ncbi:MAG: 16S rRNA (cytidine(1402)-2'-O)-methyltransferase [Rickettsiales bacterium]|jgi:16S rRNA (cytidine1402-2'-O)-methyltransferase|nr:16S rRNA (cytidine(1402)-2'-O)-methyltransferase [Rickettsiales bacterium]